MSEQQAAPASGTDVTPAATPAPAATVATSVPAASPAPASPGTAPATRSATEPTLVEGVAAPEPEESQQTPANWPGNWREILAGGDQKLLNRLNRFASPANLTKSWLAAQQKISSGELLRARPDGADPKALEEWRGEIGIPPEPKGYIEKLPDGLVIGKEDEPYLDTFLKDMHEADAPPALVHKAIQWYYKNQESIAANQYERDTQHRQQSEDALRAEWGPEFRANINGISGILDSMGPAGVKEKLFGARLADGTPLGNDPDVLRFLVSVSREINPHGTVTPHAGQTAMQTIQEEMAALEAEMRNTRNPDPNGYHKNPAKQARYKQLIEMKEQLNARG